MDCLPTEACLCAAVLMVWCVLVQSEPSCDQTEFLHTNGSCVACTVCGPGEQLSEDCGFGDGGEGVCILCKEGKFSADTGVAPCMRCTQCNLLNRLERTACSPTGDAQCGHCLPGYYELRSMTGEVELPCVPCSSHDTVHKECLLLTARGSKGESAVTASRGDFKEPKEKRVKEETFPVVLIGSATASSIFLIALLLWAVLLTAERFKHIPEYCPGPEGLFPADDLQYTPTSSPAERAAEQSEAPSQTLVPAQDPLRGLNSLSHDSEVHPTSIVINVTTNIKPSRQKEENVTQEEKQRLCCSMEEMEQKLQTIWEVAQGQSIDTLDYDSVQDLSLMLDSADSKDTLRRLGRSLGVPPQVNAHLQGFQDLFQYLRTSTYTLLPQLAQAAALLPNPEVVARIHRAVVTT
ncbi:tumor necrosis factor receptor superfamily member EDAR-like [Epinephelus lanceolatus]|uniref:tumor necrosis factor receptor superfamily member EDAR-like n=1 Tax=Epinephelus lanceolatus TaxID=310571 RepID=UPI001446DF25|nr:tumor necrosis factor receptor superfamily member EDAR-like [Epinephelus lanceolatus]